MEQFILEGARDVILLFIGGGLTIVGGLVAGKQRQRERAADREDAIRVQAREQIDRAIAAVGAVSDHIITEATSRGSL
ncbi:hypothetical protein [Microbacterium sp. CH1]|uniref:hypothetical protein n=1 Tax=Microbacterium sp. CH1 TaxID=1770208 RepID=UPI000ABE247A|nr:hypothetical protein [Microbacterium sp. CH1]